MTEIAVGIEQLTHLLDLEGVRYKKTCPGEEDPIYGTIETEKGIMTWRWI